MKITLIAVVALALATGFFGYTKSGRHMLSEMGLMTACSDSCS